MKQQNEVDSVFIDIVQRRGVCSDWESYFKNVARILISSDNCWRERERFTFHQLRRKELDFLDTRDCTRKSPREIIFPCKARQRGKKRNTFFVPIEANSPLFAGFFFVRTASHLRFHFLPTSLSHHYWHTVDMRWCCTQLSFQLRMTLELAQIRQTSERGVAVSVKCGPFLPARENEEELINHEHICTTYLPSTKMLSV